MSTVIVSVTADGTPVAEADLRDGGIEDAVAESRRVGARVLWAYGVDLETQGFRRVGGYTRLKADDAPLGIELPAIRDPELLLRLYVEGYRGIWGHKQLDLDAAVALAERPELVHLVLGEIGLCRVDTVARLIDAPGIVTEERTVGRYVELVGAAGFALGGGHAELESWGDRDETLAAYEALGYAVVQRIQGFELPL
ncbi:MAG: hypothetical protein MSC30_03245 [Gaiellaceae bacterium MAG52_C11]|nr:hypothetical protein [Candidatus Gaiellasilicea maunaloa]